MLRVFAAFCKLLQVSATSERNLVEVLPLVMNNEARAHLALCARASLFSRFTDTNVCGTDSVKYL